MRYELLKQSPITERFADKRRSFDLTTNSKKPKNTLIVTQDQLAVIEQFADQRKDAELNTIYRLNECEFRILLHFDFGAVKHPCI